MCTYDTQQISVYIYDTYVHELLVIRDWCNATYTLTSLHPSSLNISNDDLASAKRAFLTAKKSDFSLAFAVAANL
jgi:hypothetical protein